MKQKRPASKSPHKKKPATRLQPGRKLHRHARFLPALVIAGFATLLSLQPQLFAAQSDVLSYATNTSVAGLLQSTNAQRGANGAAALAGNGLLNAAAQAKANDMVARNYWSHQTPDGQQPWVFFTNAGYQYTSAGENLAYGFQTSADTITGWMNSPPHKANLLSVNYTEVGFGFANSTNFVGDGQQTVVVAMYGKPVNAPAPAPAVSAAPPAAAKPAAKPATKPAATSQSPAPVPAPAAAAAEPPVEIAEEPDLEPIASAPTEDRGTPSAPTYASPHNVSRVELLGGSLDGWGASIVLLAVASSAFLWLIHKGFQLRRYLVAGENYLLHHIHVDFTVASVVFLGYVLLATSGVIR